MQLQELRKRLDGMFNIGNIPVDMPFSNLLPQIYGASGIPVEKYYAKDFNSKFHGLMFENGNLVEKVYRIVFLSREVLDKIFEKNETDLLIFSHHPMEMETSGKGFIPLPEKYLNIMKERRISVYVLHTPLDIHEEISTSESIAKKIRLTNQKRYAQNSIGFSGIVGELKSAVSFEEFVKIVSTVCEIRAPHFVKKTANVKKVGIIAGGGSFIGAIEETISLGCDTYLTGEYINKINNEYGMSQRKEVEEYIDKININLIECSHYATEKVVIKDEIKKIFDDLSLISEFVEQDNPWY